MPKFSAIVEIECASRQEAEQVLIERLGVDEDYGFTYTVRWWDLLSEDD